MKVNADRSVTRPGRHASTVMGEVAQARRLSADSGRLAAVSGQRTLSPRSNSFNFNEMRLARIVRKGTLPPGDSE
jgi:hypothetical protein